MIFFHFSYKQRKFNLFREECEGFAKLLTELNTKFNDQTNPTDLIGIVHSLIGKFFKTIYHKNNIYIDIYFLYFTGCFNLDPNRVLDIILESFENKPKDAKIFVPLINSYMNDPQIICEVLATKLAFLKNNQQDVPQSLYILIAQLLQYKIIKLDDIYCWVRNTVFKLL